MLQIVPRKVHAVLDYGYAVKALALPHILGFADDKNANAFFKAQGLMTLAASLCTAYELGVWKKIPFRTHLMLDAGGGLLGLAAPWLLGFSENKRARNVALALAIFELLAVAMSKTDEAPIEK